MLSVRDPLEFFNAKYRSSADPWCVGEITWRKTYQEILRIVARLKRGGYRAALDVGCGTGHLSEALAAFSQRVVGTDIAETAIALARRKHACRENLAFHLWDVRLPPGEDVQRSGLYDLVLCSEVLYYYAPDVVTQVLARLRTLLAPDGHLVLVHSTEGPRYNLDELVRFTVPHFAVLETGWIENHAYIVAVTPRPYLALTLDYEAFEYPRKPDIEREVIRPTARLLDLADEHGARLSLFVEVGEMIFWDRHAPEISAPMKEQIRAAYRRGHDVQLHLHPRWLPRLGADYDARRGRVAWDLRRGCLALLDAAELRAVLAEAHLYLCGLLAPVDPHYRPTVFRAGKYQILPHAPTFRILRELGYEADCSVWKGGYKATCEGMPGFDFRHLWTSHEPFWPAADDINVAAPDDHARLLLELPITSDGSEALSLDCLDADHFATLLESFRASHAVAIGHPKCLADEAHWRRLERILQRVGSRFALGGVRHLAASYLSTRSDDAESQQYAAALGYYHRVIPSLEQIAGALRPCDRQEIDLVGELMEELRARREAVRVLDYGCGTGELLAVPLAARYRDRNEITITGRDASSMNLVRGRAHARRNRLDPLTFVGDGSRLEAGSYDLVCCRNVLERCGDAEMVFEELVSLLGSGGLLYVSVANSGSLEASATAWMEAAMRLVCRHGTLLRLGVFLKRRLRSLAHTSASREEHLPVMGTTNPADGIHRQRFRFDTVPRMAARRGLIERRAGNRPRLVGLGSGLPVRLPLLERCDALLGQNVPRRWASGWWYVFEKR